MLTLMLRIEFLTRGTTGRSTNFSKRPRRVSLFVFLGRYVPSKCWSRCANGRMPSKSVMLSGDISILTPVSSRCEELRKLLESAARVPYGGMATCGENKKIQLARRGHLSE